MRTSTRYALAATLATTLMGGTAYAADLGGNCCADLEERIAELEATTVRKGNRKVSLQLSGYVSHNVMWWDDGTQSDTYIGDGGNYGSRFRFRGNAKINPELSASYLFEWQSNANAIGSTNQLNGGDDLGNTGGTGGCTQTGNSLGGSGCIVMRQSVVSLEHSRLGSVRMGHGSTATDDLVLIDLGGLAGAATPDVGLYMGGMILRGNNSLFATNDVGTGAGATWTSAIRGHESWDTNRRNMVIYQTPTLHGFNVQAAVAEDNFWDIALRYAGEFNGIRVAFGIGYLEDTKFNAANQGFTQNGVLCGVTAAGVAARGYCDVKATDLKGSASVLHVPTGLFATFAAGSREIEGSHSSSVATTYTGPDLKFWWLAGGVSKNFFGPGLTVLFGEYGEHKGGLAQAAFLNSALDGTNGHCTILNGVSTNAALSCGSTVTSWGIGVVQHIDAAAMEIYAAYKNYELETNGFAGNSITLNKSDRGVADMSSFILGTRIQF